MGGGPAALPRPRRPRVRSSDHAGSMTSTEANPSGVPARPSPIGHRTVLAIAIPMTLAHLSTPLVGIVDGALIGWTGDAAMMGGIAVGALAFDILFSFFSFLRMGTTGLAAQAFGAGDKTEQRAVLARALMAAVVLGAGLVVCAVPLCWAFVTAIGASPAVNTAFAGYFMVRILAAPLTLLNYSVLGWVVGIGRAGIGLALQLLLNGVNMAAGVALVWGLGLGTAGAGGAAVAAEAVAAVAGLVVVVVLTRGGAWPAWARLAERRAVVATFAVNRDIMIRSVALTAALGFFTAQGARHGDVVLAANAVLFNLVLAGSYFLDGLATAAEQLAGRAIGARQPDDFRRAVSLSVGWGFFMAGVLTAIFALGGPTLIDLMTASPEVREMARHYLFWVLLAPAFGVLAFELDGVFIGATWSSTMRDMMLVSLAGYFALWAVLAPMFGNHGLWAALIGFFGLRGLTLAACLPRRLKRAFAAAPYAPRAAQSAASHPTA